MLWCLRHLTLQIESTVTHTILAPRQVLLPLFILGTHLVHLILAQLNGCVCCIDVLEVSERAHHLGILKPLLLLFAILSDRTAVLQHTKPLEANRDYQSD